MENGGNKIAQVRTELILPNPYQPRKVFSRANLEELAKSILAYGIIQPLAVRNMGDEKYELIAGERRLKAAKLAKMEVVPVIIYNDFNDRDSAIIAMIENLQREELNYIEEAEGYYNLIKDHGLTQAEIAKKVGKNQSTIANKIRILRLSSEIKERLIEENLTERHARSLLKIHDDELRKIILEKVIKNDYTVKKTEEIVMGILEDITEDKTRKSKQNIKAIMSYRIYMNTIKQAFKAIKEMQNKAEFEQVDKGDHIEVIMRIPKI
ncbi:ParB/RepB/Spo0J family partition protein [bacterium AH-315-E09]|nr:ParB/RepB/Spo0J family partition protein [Alkaliphilus transvaalensis]MBN4074700.1 ParB/RepB/Spo0J family partition protein [bacterium AH-315-E09]